MGSGVCKNSRCWRRFWCIPANTHMRVCALRTLLTHDCCCCCWLIRDVTWSGIAFCLHFDWYCYFHTFSLGKNLVPKTIKLYRSSTLSFICLQMCACACACAYDGKQLSNWLNGSFLLSFSKPFLYWLNICLIKRANVQSLANVHSFEWEMYEKSNGKKEALEIY